MRFTLLHIAILLFWLIAPVGVASADTQMDVEAGWGVQASGNRWTPLFVTVSDSKPRNVLLDITWPVGNHPMHIQQDITIDVEPRTFPLMVPVHGYMYQPPRLVLIDSDTGKTLAHFPKDPDSYQQLFDGQFNPQSQVIGLSGRVNHLYSMQAATGVQKFGYLPYRRLPTMAMGYDELDVLVLNQPDLASSDNRPDALSDEQQKAIVEWVRAGGKLLIWPGDKGLPAHGPLADVLPATVGVAENIALSPADLQAIGLPARFKRLLAYHLDPRAGADARPLFNQGQAIAYAGNLGLGKIVLAPVNAADLQFDESAGKEHFWLPLLKDIVEVSNHDEHDYGSNSHDTSASMRVANFLGDVPGAGQFGFGMVVYVLIGLMIVVGPLDWLVLKRLGRQSWTWVTTGGWIALVTTAAIYAGYLFKSGDLHFRTLSMIDQVGDATVASTDYVSLYSPRTRGYHVQTDPDGWWQPGAVNDYGGGLKLDADFHQTSHGNTPEASVVSVWSLQFLRGDHMGTGPALLSAKLHAANGDGQTHINGSITNLSGHALKNLHVEAFGLTGDCLAPGVQPGAAPATEPPLVVDAGGVIEISATLLPMRDEANRSSHGLPYRYQQAEMTTEPDLWLAAADLSHRRGKEMSERALSGKFAIVYAEVVDPTPAAALANEKPIEKHYQFIRALVPLSEAQ